ncbi:WxcM-like domain-containing protein [bacterium C-53]|nr:WxcM-like domain-containing protein [Lachnospiraceae bacterium]NBI01618.1 WxcM-like domain-containing protein [Lachnospiraceae bacterium]RKJ12913.1 WxcM-like domain-containing protein [bacterium C-53]
MDNRADIKKQYKVLEFDDFGDERGNLVVAEGGIDIPFEIKRVFYMYGSDSDIVRGQHANRRTEFVLINVSGSSKVKVDNGFETDIIELNKPRMGLYITTMVWKDMYDFSSDSVLLVLASEHYDAEEYIRDYTAFIEEIHGGA